MVVRLFLFSLLAVAVNAYAIPTIAIPNLVYSDVETTPITHSVVSNETGESSLTKKSKASIITQVSKQVQKDLQIFNAAVRGAIISSKQFKVINMPKNSEVWNGNTQTILDFVEGYNKLHNKSQSNINDSQVVTIAAKNDNLDAESNSNSGNLIADIKETKTIVLPKYILLGQVVAITENENINPIKDTDKTTKQYNIDIVADYSLINTTDDSIMASFTAIGHSSDVKILTRGSNEQVQKSNIPSLIKSASKDLASDVLQQLEEQLKISRQTYDNESKVITDVKIYND